MVRIRRTPPHPMLDLRNRMERVMEQLLADVKPMEHRSTWVPRADMYETADGFVLTVELPGVERDEIEILVDGSYLSLSGERSEPVPDRCMRWHQMEIHHGRFERVLALPKEADAEKITATYQDGFLTVNIPRLPPRSVDITQT